MNLKDYYESKLFMRESRHRTKSDIVSAYVRESIITGHFKPGDRIGQIELAETLQLSPTPVREALRQLSAQGVLTHVPHQGVQVSQPTLQEVDEIYRIRVHLEGMAIEEASRHLDDEALDSFEEMALDIMPDLLQQCAEQGDFTPFRIVNYKFHRTLYLASELVVVPDLIDNLWARAMIHDEFFEYDPDRAQESAEEHGQIVRALRKKNGKLARAILEKHVDENRRIYLQYLTDQAAPRTHVVGVETDGER